MPQAQLSTKTSSTTNLFFERITAGLQRKALILPSRYSEKVRVMGPPYAGPWTFTYHPWLKGIIDCKCDRVYTQKAAQMGVTEAALNKVFHTLDYLGLNVMYVLPAFRPDASNFSAGRFNPALELSERLRLLFTDTNNVDHKRAGTANLYVRGSRSRSQLKSVPINFLVMDELDEMEQRNISLALERLSGQKAGSAWGISTPTIESYGINLLFEQTTKNSFFFPCPSCGKFIDLIYPRNLVVTGDDPNENEINHSHLICHECGNVLNHSEKPNYLSKGIWVPECPNRNTEGFYINQLYSCALHPSKVAIKSLLARNNPADDQEFHNSTLGRPHATEGSRVTDKEIIKCVGDYVMASPAQAQKMYFLTMGIDVGKRIHVEIDSWYWETLRGIDTNVFANCKVVFAGEFDSFEQIDRLIYDFTPRKVVIDFNPERRKAEELAKRFWGRVHVCEYPPGLSGRNLNTKDEDLIVQADRTAWLDLSLGRFHNGTIVIPRDLPHDYADHIKALTRIYYRDRDDNIRSKYVKGAVSDHYAHARNYAEIAFTLATVGAGSSSIESPR